MKITSKIRQLLAGGGDYFEEDDENQEEYSEEEEYETETRPQYTHHEKKSTSRYSGTSSPKVVDIHTTAKLQVVLRKPERFDEQKSIADELMNKRTVVLNLEVAPRDEASKLLCFLSGVAYANGGNLKKIANNTYIITPYNVDVMGDLLDELENNGMFFV